MSDYSEQGAVPVEPEDASNPTVAEVEQRQREEFPEQYRTARHALPSDAPIEGDNGGG